MGLLHRTTRSDRRPRARALGASAALLGVLLMSSGAALLATAGSAGAATTATDCVPSEEYTTYIHHDAVTHVVQIPAQTHTVHHDAVAAVPDKWWNWSPNNSQGPQNYVPDFPSDARGTWQGPHTDGGPQQGTYGTFQTGGGNSPFFHRTQGTEGKAAYDEVVVDKPASEETVVDKAAYDEPVVHPAVTCDTTTPQDATATASTSAPQSCEGLGSFTVTGEHIKSTEPAAGPHASGEFNVLVTAEDGHLFDNGLSTKTLEVYIPWYDGQCGSEETLQATPDVSFLDDCTTNTVYLPLSQLARSAADSTVITQLPAGPYDINGVHYVLSGSLATGGTVTVTATPWEGWTFPEGTADPSVFTKAFKACSVVDPPNQPTVVTPPTTPTKTTVTPAKTTTKATTATKTASTTTIPTVVHAGLAGDVVDAAGSHTQQGIALLVAGALVLLAGGLGMTRRTGAHARA